jgi:tetratricopeptide (TPR) repeat protein
VLEALARLCQDTDPRAGAALLRRHAPMWLAQLPSLTEPDERMALEASLAGATQERMLREGARALEAFAAEHTLVLWIDDLHWSDVSTLDLLSLVARRSEPARLLVVGTYRPAEVAGESEPLGSLARDLQRQGQCVELRLPSLDLAAVTEYVGRRCGAESGGDLARILHARTEGNPLFMVSVIDDLLDRGLLVGGESGWSFAGDIDDVAAPRTVRQLLESELDRVDATERALLEVASLAGMEFSAATAAAATGEALEVVEARCEALAQQGRFLRPAGDERWPDGTVASRYAFLHALHRDVLDARVPAARRAQAHRAIGLRKEAAWREPGEIRLRLALSVPLAATLGYAAPGLAENIARIQTLYRDLDESPDLVTVLLGLWSLHVLRAELGQARELATSLLRIAERSADAGLGLQAHRVVGHTLFYGGELRTAAEHLERALAHHDPHLPHRLDVSAGDDPVVLCLSYSAWTLWFLGHPARALERVEAAMAQADALAHPPSQAFAMSYAAVLHQLRRDPERARTAAEAVLALAEREGFFLWTALGNIVLGWARAAEGATAEGIERLEYALAAWELAGAKLGLPYFSGLLVEAYLADGRLDEADTLLARVARGIVESGQVVFEPERLRLVATLALRRAGEDGGHASRRLVTAAESALRDAVALATAQDARMLALRAASGLTRVLVRDGRRQEGRLLLAPLLASFGEGHDTADLRDAAAALRDAE